MTFLRFSLVFPRFHPSVESVELRACSGLFRYLLFYALLHYLSRRFMLCLQILPDCILGIQEILQKYSSFQKETTKRNNYHRICTIFGYMSVGRSQFTAFTPAPHQRRSAAAAGAGGHGFYFTAAAAKTERLLSEF